MLKKRLFVVIVAVDGGFLDQLVQVRWGADHALDDLTFLYEILFEAR
jgi:hypothetical protein